MNWVKVLFKNSIGRKIIMALSGLLLVTFLLVHAGINALVFYNDGGATFDTGAHFMGTNPLIRTIEIFLIIFFLLHIVQGLVLWKDNRNARTINYKVSSAPAKSSWYSRSMALLGTLVLLFLIMHTSNFWIPNRVNQLTKGTELPLYDMMYKKFQSPIVVLLYTFSCFSLFWHLLHGFKSAFHSLGLSYKKYLPLIKFCGIVYSFVIPTVLAMIPVSFYFHWIK